MHNLGALKTTGEVGPDDDVVIETPRIQGGNWGIVGLGSRGRLRRGGVRVRGPRIGSTAVVVPSSCGKD
jgi:hypothetical protein